MVPTSKLAVPSAFALCPNPEVVGKFLVRAEVHLDPTTSADTIRQVAQQRHIRHIAWINGGWIARHRVLKTNVKLLT